MPWQPALVQQSEFWVHASPGSAQVAKFEQPVRGQKRPPQEMLWLVERFCGTWTLFVASDCILQPPFLGWANSQRAGLAVVSQTWVVGAQSASLAQLQVFEVVSHLGL